MRYLWCAIGFGVAGLMPRGLSPAQGAHQSRKPVELNHVVMVVNSTTYESILRSTFLSTDFANGGVQTVVAGPDESWTGRYVLGENLYLEIFGPGGHEGRDPGYVGFAFSTVAMGDIDSIYTDLARSAGPRANNYVRTRQVQGEERPWFHAVSVGAPSLNRGLGAWIMEWAPNHLRRLALKPDILPSRKEYLWALRRGRGAAMPPPDRLLADIKRIDLVLTAEERHDLEMLLLAGGWRQAATQTGTVRLSRPGLDLYIATARAPNPRLRSIEFSLTQRPVEDRQLQFGGGSTLTIRRDGSARWTFR